MHQGFPLLPYLSHSLHHHPSDAQGHLHAIQPNLDLLHTRHENPPWTPLRCSSTLSTCPNHLNTLWSGLLANSHSIPALLRISSFLTLPFVTLQPNFSNASSREHSLSFSQHYSYSMPLLGRKQLVQLLLLIDNSSHLSSNLYCLARFSVLPTLLHLIHCVPHPFHNLHPLALATPGT